MSGSRLLLAGLGTALLLATVPAHAFRCGTRIITRGDHVGKLLHYCGEPVSVQTRFTQRAYSTTPGGVFVPGLVEEVVVEEWTYNLGPHQLMRVVRLENGFVAEVKQLGYGY